MRIEMKLRHLKLRFKDLPFLDNPFADMQVYDRHHAEKILSAHGLIIPKNKCIAHFLRTDIRDGKKRQRIRQALAPARAGWWDSEYFWRKWPTLLNECNLRP